MMFESQTLLSHHMEEMKDASSVLTCYRCNRTIKAVDTLNEEECHQSRGSQARQLDLFQMFKKKQARKMSDIDMQQSSKAT